MNDLRQWILRMVVISMLCAVAEELMPSGAVKRVGKLACGLVILWGILTPMVQIREYLNSEWGAEYQLRLEQNTQELKEQVEWQRKDIIENKYASYIVGKAAELGVTCTVQVRCRQGEEGLYFPEYVKLTGQFSDVEQSRMTQLLEEELEIPALRQEYYWKEESP